ncbi:hypothetical protein HK100_008214, partial [Physocladia obscura]
MPVISRRRSSLSLASTDTQIKLAHDITSFTIELDDSDGTVFFEPSQGIQGRSILILSKPTAIASVKIQVQGIVSGGLAYSLLGPENSSKLAQPLPLTCHRHLFLDTITLFPSAASTAIDGSHILAPGKHTWPFSFRVPPVSILPPTYRGKMGSVRYEAVTVLERVGGGGVFSQQADELMTRKIVMRREIPVRSIETRQGRRAFETPVFKTVDISVGGGKIELA